MQGKLHDDAKPAEAKATAGIKFEVSSRLIYRMNPPSRMET